MKNKIILGSANFGKIYGIKKNFLVTTGLVDMWEFNENNFLLVKWC